MTILIFFIILGVLVFVHELGHFLAAKKAGVKVDEFGFGYPPRAYRIGEKWGTVFTLNWIPFGGFVKIFGENYEEEAGEEHSLPQQKSFIQVSKKWQATILAAGVVFNILFAWFLFSFGFLIGLPTSVDNSMGAEVKNPALTIIDIVPSSPAQVSGLKAGDKIMGISYASNEVLQDLEPDAVSDFINKSSGEVLFEIDRGGKTLNFEILPDAEIVEGKKIIGINMDIVGTLSLPIHKAIYEGGKTTFNIMHLTVSGISNLIKDAVQGDADMSNIAGPVGIVGLVGDASRLGFAYLLTFTALISINLAIINLVPFPALDGGRILFVIIEGIIKRPINPKFAMIANTVGFALLIALMLFITYRDILRLF
ncbi:MAG: RIP metalloprotease RseP [Candidatus Zambryskibacteria bacterium RIFOXYC1_FULL_39_10]|uniref:Zinc metalloprotease n=1 Tax=Candidatus Zambryskibacteria bacterium RIFOXYC1_FULL_39_10 TaxID=1802779 RepID=A0A1G2UYU2_9BACT|nr:MAG: RIP metalloprotease RseP [Candidatus Zambryskibacteria bacterium RIFOXYC1_FULL_39_10]OHB15447.1 MAG: RIP metalloprotease RseP [Candidatus Zambryskibacteria bacterium RIFOXYD1_FULL_39_35]